MEERKIAIIKINEKQFNNIKIDDSVFEVMTIECLDEEIFSIRPISKYNRVAIETKS